MKLTLRSKIFLSFIALILLTILITNVIVHYSIAQQIKHLTRNKPLYIAEKLRPALEQKTFLISFRRSQTWIALGVLIAAIFLSLLSARLISQPIQQISEATDEIARGNYQKRVQLDTEDEIGKLAKSLNKMAENLAQNEKLRRELVANVSHELATPLTNINGYLEALEDGTISQNEEKATWALIQEETQRLIRLVKDLRSLSIIESAKFKLQKEKIDLKEIVAKVVKKMQPSFNKKNIQLQINISSFLPSLYADPHRLTQILINLLQNALQFTPPQGKVEVSISEIETPPKAIQMKIQDNGIGIKEDDLPHIWERFFRADRSRSDKTGGTGVGLTIVKELVQTHEWNIKVKSKIGTGTTFTLMIPLNQT